MRTKIAIAFLLMFELFPLGRDSYADKYSTNKWNTQLITIRVWKTGSKDIRMSLRLPSYVIWLIQKKT